MTMRIGYYRVLTTDQSVAAQRHALGGKFDRKFIDEGISDSAHVYAVDRLGRDAIDVQSTVRRLIAAGIVLDIHGIGVLAGDTAQLILAVLAQLAQMERAKIRDRTAAGREAARASLAATGRTHRGKKSLGRPKARDGAEVVAWRSANVASIAETATRFNLSEATIKRYCAQANA
jgi:putative DNA-invertase from lambdoid prophage Rac